MAKYYFDYWKRPTVDALIARAETLDYAYGKTFRGSDMQAGDVVWILSGDGYRALWLVGTIEMRGGVVSQAEAKRLLGRSRLLGAEADQYIVNVHAGKRPLRKLQAFSIAERLDFLTLAGTLSPKLPMERIKRGKVGFGNCLQSSRRLTAEAHALLERTLLIS